MYFATHNSLKVNVLRGDKSLRGIQSHGPSALRSRRRTFGQTPGIFSRRDTAEHDRRDLQELGRWLVVARYVRIPAKVSFLFRVAWCTAFRGRYLLDPVIFDP